MGKKKKEITQLSPPTLQWRFRFHLRLTNEPLVAGNFCLAYKVLYDTFTTKVLLALEQEIWEVLGSDILLSSCVSLGKPITLIGTQFSSFEK